MNDLIRSECGQYLTERSVPSGQWRHIYDRNGKDLGQTNYWTNRYTPSRIGFECGFGEIEACFSYPRYPRWFRRRWVCCFDVWIDDLVKIVERHGGTVLTGFKMGMSVWSCVGFRATAQQLHAIDAEIAKRTAKWNGPPSKVGQWDIGCPSNAAGAIGKIRGPRP